MEIMEQLCELHPAAQVAIIVMLGLVACVIAYGLFVKDW